MVVESLTRIEVPQLQELAADSLQRITSHQLPNGLIPASVGRYDDEHFNGMVWIKDMVRAVQLALDPSFQQVFPELMDSAKQLYLSSMRALLRIQGQPEQLRRFQNRPSLPDNNGYSTINDRDAPAIRFTSGGHIYQDWGHNQPDNWGTLLLGIGKGIEAGWPILDKDESQPIPLGATLQKIISYTVHLRTERLVCRSIWEHGNVWSSYSTRRIVLAGLDQIERIWPELMADSELDGYQLKVSQNQLKDAADGLREKVTEHFPADYTDTENHKSATDLASLVVLNDIDLPKEERIEIVNRIATAALENHLGFYRYFGDPYKKGRAEAKWTMGKPIIARHYFLQAIELYKTGKPEEAFRALGHGLDRIANILTIKEAYGYIPELFEDGRNSGYIPNNNELAWTLGYVIEAAAAGIVALSESEKYH